MCLVSALDRLIAAIALPPVASINNSVKSSSMSGSLCNIQQEDVCLGRGITNVPLLYLERAQDSSAAKTSLR